jgi:hypothetical protein
MRVAGLVGDLVGARDKLLKAKGITLIESTQIRRFSRWSGGGGWSLLSEAKSLKTSSRDHQARVQSTQIRWCSWWPGGRLVRISEGQTQGLHPLKLKPRGTTRLESNQIRWFLWQTGGRLDWLPSGQRCSRKESEKDSRVQESDRLNKHQLTLSQEMIEMRWEPSHRSVWQSSENWRREMLKLMKMTMGENHQLSQVHVTAIKGTKELLLETQS